MDFRHELQYLADTVLMEAAGEPWEGQLAVAHVVMNRCHKSSPRLSVTDVVLRPKQFSCWNTDSPTRAILDSASPSEQRIAYKAACAAFFSLVPDPSHGSTHYLNEEVTRRLLGGRLPDWYDPAKVRARIGRHTFLTVP